MHTKTQEKRIKSIQNTMRRNSDMTITPMNTKEPRHLCLSVSKRNQRYLDLLEDYQCEFNSNKANTVFRIINEYNTYRCLDNARR